MFNIYREDNLTVLRPSPCKLLQILTTATGFCILLNRGGWDLPSLFHFRSTSLSKILALLYNAGNGLRNITEVSAVYLLLILVIVKSPPEYIHTDKHKFQTLSSGPNTSFAD